MGIETIVNVVDLHAPCQPMVETSSQEFFVLIRATVG